MLDDVPPYGGADHPGQSDEHGEHAEIVVPILRGCCLTQDVLQRDIDEDISDSHDQLGQAEGPER